MSKTASVAGSEKVDDYIARSEPFARPILDHFRKLVHRTIPDVGEALKWGMPHFVIGDRLHATWRRSSSTSR